MGNRSCGGVLCVRFCLKISRKDKRPGGNGICHSHRGHLYLYVVFRDSSPTLRTGIKSRFCCSPIQV